MRIALVVGCVLVLEHSSKAESLRPVIESGVISWTDDSGKRKKLEIGSRCADLWISPDEGTIAFVALEQLEPNNGTALQWEKGTMFVASSSIYIATRSSHFAPVLAVRGSFRIALPHLEYSSILRSPSLSEDGDTVFFRIPYGGATGLLMKKSLTTGKISRVIEMVEYCPVWGGSASGDLLLMRRRQGHTIEYWCEVMTRGGLLAVLNGGQCMLNLFGPEWSIKKGGACPIAVSDESVIPR